MQINLFSFSLAMSVAFFSSLPYKANLSKSEGVEVNTIAYQDDSRAVVTAKTGLSLRKQPKTDAQLIAMLPTNTVVKVLEKGKDETIKGKTAAWYKVSYGTKTGYAFGAYLKIGGRVGTSSKNVSNKTEGMGSIQTDFSDALQKGLVVTKSSNLNMRKAADAKSEKIGEIPRNEEVAILSYESDLIEVQGIQGVWCKVRYGKKEGFVFNGFLCTSTATITAKSGLTMRAEPREMAKRITVIPFDKEVYLLPPSDVSAETYDNVFTDSKNRTWYKVRYGKFEGWSLGDYLEMQEGC